MILNNHKTSLLVPQQLPEFIRDDVNYQTFVTFLQSYYEWLETAQSANSANSIATISGEGVSYASKNLPTYYDIDSTLDGFVDYFLNDFLPYIPSDALADKRKLLKISQELYKTKGTPASYQFLFRTLFNSSAEIFQTSDTTLKVSDGKWVVTKSLKIDSLDTNWLLINNLRVFGETTKSYATVDYGTVTGTKTEIFISNIERLFNSGEFIRVVDNNNQDVYFYNNQIYIQNSGIVIPSEATTLRGKIVGVISQINIQPQNQGLYYNSGDPVVIVGGLNSNIANPSGATAQIGTTSSGSIRSILVTNPSNGYQLAPNSSITFSGGGGTGSVAEISLLDTSKLTSVGFIVGNTLGLANNVVIGNTSNPATYNVATFAHPGVSNTNSKFIDAFKFLSFPVGPIASVKVDITGTGYSSIPVVEAHSLYNTDLNSTELKNLGMLQPISIVSGGTAYANNDTIAIVGGSGQGAYANIVVNSTGTIVHANYVFSSANSIITYPLGGLGYKSSDLPQVVINTQYGSGAVLTIPGIMGDGAILSPAADKIGSVQTITITNPGEDYISTPLVYLNVEDISISNVSGTNSIQSGDVVYQGNTYSTSTYSANLNFFIKTSIDPTGNSANDIYTIRVYNYVGVYNDSLNLHIDRTIANTTHQLTFKPNYSFINKVGQPTSFIKYGDGNAKAKASFLNGLIVGQGKYLNEDGQPSSLGLVLESIDYNKFTYVLSVEESLNRYKNIVLDLLHPSGTRLIGRNLIRSFNNFNLSTVQSGDVGLPLADVAGSAAYATLTVDGIKTAASNNIIKLTNVIAGNIGNTIATNSIVYFSSTNNVKFYSTVIKVDYANNQLIMKDSVFLTYPNVAVGYANASSNVINITSVTGQFDGNFGDYDAMTRANNIIYVGDSVSLNSGPYYKVTNVFANGNISVANNTFGPINNALITVNKNANTQSVLVYDVIGLYNYPELTTESGYSIITESGNLLLVG